MLFSILNRVVDDAVADRLREKGFGDVRASHSRVFEMIDPSGSRISEMAERARITKQAMGERVTELEDLGYLARRPDPRDRRARLIVFTPKGSEAVGEAVAAVTELEAAWTAALGERRIRSVHRALSTLALRFGAAHIRLPEEGRGSRGAVGPPVAR